MSKLNLRLDQSVVLSDQRSNQGPGFTANANDCFGTDFLLHRRRALRAAGSKVTYFAGYRHADRYRVEDIEAVSDVVVWCCDEPPGFSPRRPQDRAFVGNLVQRMQAYASGALGKQAIPFSSTEAPTA